AKAGEEYLISEPAVIATQPEEVDPELTKIYYTTTDEQTITSFFNPSGLNLVSNSYENGRGVITFDGVITQIPNNFMYGKSTLKSIVLPGAVTQIGYGAFESCSSLEHVTLPNGLAEIGQEAFAYTALRELILPESVAEIYNQAFMHCSDLERVTISGSPAVNTDAFRGCSSISSVHITSLEAWCKCDFGGFSYQTTSLSNPCSYGASLYLNGTPLTGVTIPDGVTTLSDGAFTGCSSIVSVTIPEHVTEIGSYSFNTCANLKAIYCLSATPATPKPVSFWDLTGDLYHWYPFHNQAEERKIYVPNASVESYRTAWLWKQYADCIYPMDPVEETWKIYYTSTDGKIVEPHDHYAFGFDYATWTYPTIVSNSYSNGKGTIVFDKEITSMGDYAFMECTNLESIIIPESVTSIGAYAFSNCSLSAILIPDAVVEIGNQAFSGCSKLASATIGQGVTSIGAGAFYRCDSLEAITIPDNVTTIDNEAFFNCDALVSATIGSGVTSIGGSVFYDCNKLETVYCYPTTPPVTSFGGATWSAWAAFDSCSTALKIYVPNASVAAYKTAEGWSDYAADIVGYDF
ncbi:MAG: leucine-rich repeat domain-containing protein, partial [Rikenellaceae bacterium]|nr:leucine-rich repeat domain-containing protein [Rikenellaceae bacterium]